MHIYCKYIQQIYSNNYAVSTMYEVISHRTIPLSMVLLTVKAGVSPAGNGCYFSVTKYNIQTEIWIYGGNVLNKSVYGILFE